MSKQRTPYDRASDVAAEGGEVIVDGPDGIAISLTPDAAQETGERMLRCADEARRQKPTSQPQQ